MNREIDYLKANFKDTEEKRASYCVNKGDKTKSDSGVQFGDCNQK